MDIAVGVLCIAFVFGLATAAGRSLDRAKRQYANRQYANRPKAAFAEEDLYGDM